MSPGPPPRPLEEKRALGNPGHQRLPKPSATIPLTRIAPKPPPGFRLGPAGRRMWTHVAGLPWVAASDAPSLELMCQAADLLATMEDNLVEHGLTYTSRGREYSHPLLTQVAAARKLLWAQLGSFGLSPADRSRLGVAEVRGSSKFQELMERRAGLDAERDSSG